MHLKNPEITDLLHSAVVTRLNKNTNRENIPAEKVRVAPSIQNHKSGCGRNVVTSLEATVGVEFEIYDGFNFLMYQIFV